MYTVQAAFDRERVEDYFANAFKKYIGKTALPHTQVSLLSSKGHVDTVTKLAPHGDNEYFEETRDITVISVFILFTIVENTHVVNYSGVYDFHFYNTDAESVKESVAYEAIVGGTREVSVKPRHVEGEFEDGA